MDDHPYFHCFRLSGIFRKISESAMDDPQGQNDSRKKTNFDGDILLVSLWVNVKILAYL